MLAPRLAQVVYGLLGLALTTEASGQSQVRSRATAPQARPMSARAAAYLAGKQALVGSHAPSEDSATLDARGRPMLGLRSINRGDLLTIESTGDGGFMSVDLDRAAHFLRAMSGDEHPVDSRTLSLVYRIQRHFAVPEIRIVSGYRTPKPGSHSNHGRGRAIDLVVPGTPDAEVARFVRQVGFVGVGVYPRSQFVHVDIRPRSYFWIDDSGPHKRSREHGILGDLAASSDAEALSRHQAVVEPFGVGIDVDAALRANGFVTPSSAPEEDEEDESY
jgi:uncharacterized protein YcbK (DUF882 family)